MTHRHGRGFVAPSEVLRLMVPGEPVTASQLMKRLPPSKRSGINDCLRRLEAEGRVKRTTHANLVASSGVTYTWEIQ